MNKFNLVQCPDPMCGAFNSSKDFECAQCGCKLNNRPHKQDSKRDNPRRTKKRFDDEGDDDDMVD